GDHDTSGITAPQVLNARPPPGGGARRPGGEPPPPGAAEPQRSRTRPQRMRHCKRPLRILPHSRPVCMPWRQTTQSAQREDISFWVPPELEWRRRLVHEQRRRRLCENGHFEQGFGNGIHLRRMLNKNSVPRAAGASTTATRIRYCMNHPWLTTMDWPVNAFEPNDARNSAVSATSSTVVNSPSTVSLSMTLLITCSSVMPSSLACSGICFSTSGVRTKPGQITLARTPCAAPSLATTFASPIRPCFAVT